MTVIYDKYSEVSESEEFRDKLDVNKSYETYPNGIDFTSKFSFRSAQWTSIVSGTVTVLIFPR